MWLASSLAQAQPPSASTAGEAGAAPEVLWQPPQTDLDCRPNVCPAGYKFYGEVDYILWWSEKDRPIPPLIPGTVPSGAVTLPEMNNFGALTRNGVQGDLGVWLNPQQSCGLEAGGFWVDNRSPGNHGQVDDLGVRSQFHNELWGTLAQLRVEVYRGTWAHLDALTGFRHLSLDEALAIAERDSAADVVTSDRLGTHNRFYGGRLGAEMVFHYDKCFVDIWGAAALGVNDETIDVNGTTTTNGQAVQGGILTPPAVDGQHHRDQFAVVPEVGINIGYELTQHFRVRAGYSFLYLSEAARPGSQADVLLHSATSSVFPFQSGDFWVQGLNLGFEFRF
jgi:hypothetical protein